MESVEDHTRHISAGIELEGLLLFKEELLREVLPTSISVRKTGLTDDGMPLDPKLFPGWALEPQGTQFKFVLYNDEVLKIAIFLLDGARFANGVRIRSMRNDRQQSTAADQTQRPHANANRIDSSIKSDAAPVITSSGDEEYKMRNGWEIKRDLSIRPLTREKKMAIGLDNDEWESLDIELVSKPYSCGINGVDTRDIKRDVEAVVAKLSTQRSSITCSRDCGMHVHVGYTDNTRFPIKALKILAFIALVFELEISRLFAPYREGQTDKEPGEYIKSNLYRYSWDPDVPYKADWQRDHNGKKIAYNKYTRIDDLRAQFLSVENESDAAYVNLKRTFSPDKRFVVNFQNIDRKNLQGHIVRPPTIEFRQPEGTFDPETISHIVTFYTCLVRYALHLADSGLPVLPHIESWNDLIALIDLLDALDLPVETQQFLATRTDCRYALHQGVYWQKCYEDGEPVFELDDGIADECLEIQYNLPPPPLPTPSPPPPTPPQDVDDDKDPYGDAPMDMSD